MKAMLQIGAILLLANPCFNQELDTLFSYNPDTIEPIAYTGDVINAGAMFGSSQWGSLNVLAIEIQYPSVVPTAGDQLQVYALSDFFPGDPIDTVTLHQLDSAELYPNWMHIDVSNKESLKGLQYGFNLTGTALLTGLGDRSDPTGDSWYFSFERQLWHSGPNFPIRAIVERNTSSVDNRSELPGSWELASLYPNPFNPSVNISFSVLKRTSITIDVFDIKGRYMLNISNREWDIGHHDVLWNPGISASGVYYIVLSSNSDRVGLKGLYLK